MAAFLFSINGLIIEQTAGRVATDHYDVFFLSLISFAVYFMMKHVEKGKTSLFLLGGFCTGLAILTKWLPALIVLPIWMIYAYDKNFSIQKIISYSFLFAIIVGAVAIPWQIYIMHEFPQEASYSYTYNKLHFFEALGPHGKPFYFHFDKMRILFGELIYLPFIWLIYSAFKTRSNTKLLLLAWILIPYIFFSIAVTKMQGYILFCAPAIFIMTGLFYNYLQQFKPKAPWDTKKVIFSCKYPIKAMFHADVIAYEKLPNENELAKIESEGYQIYVEESKPNSSEHNTLEEVRYVHLNK